MNFDLWVQHWRRHRATREMIVVRCADDAVLGFQHRADAEQFLQDWKERLGRFGLELHPDKTRLIDFVRSAVENRKERGAGKPETFNFLGFTHICGQTWKTGKFLVLRKTIRKRLSVKLRALKEELRRRKHLSVAELGKWLWPTVGQLAFLPRPERQSWQDAQAVARQNGLTHPRGPRTVSAS